LRDQVIEPSFFCGLDIKPRSSGADLVIEFDKQLLL
jgi:hypothetical protein